MPSEYKNNYFAITVQYFLYLVMQEQNLALN